MSNNVVSVLGEIQPETLGRTLSHDHLLLDPRRPQNFAGTDYESILDDEELAVDEVILFKSAGGGTICDPTNEGLSRDPAALKRISEATGVNILMGSGWYRQDVYPSCVYERSVGWLADHLVADLTQGADGTDVRAGFIGEIGTERGYISPAQERVFRAAARASKTTGCPIMTHTTHWGELAIEQLDLLQEEGIDPSRIIVSHLGDRPRMRGLVEIARRGAWMSIDNLGAFTEYLPLEVRADNVVGLWEAGYGGQILLGNDVCALHQLSFYGGGGYGHVLTAFVPLLRDRGLTDEEIDRMLVTNPGRAYAWS